MSVALVTGSSGLVGSETCRYFSKMGLEIVGIDNNMREYFFGKGASTVWMKKQLQSEISNYRNFEMDIRDEKAIASLFQDLGKNISVIIHTAAQPSHDWAAKEPFTDFSVNANGTLNLLEAARRFAPEAIFIFTSTNKVYGDLPNFLPLKETETRWEIEAKHPWAQHGIDETMSIDQTKHSLFGASKVAADILVQEYGRYFGMKTAVFRGGCLTGPSHSGAELHGFLAYLVKCVVASLPYTIFGYKGKQVRDNIHSEDLVNAFWQYFEKPKLGAVYNMGGSRASNCSMIEAIQLAEKISGKKLNYKYSDQARSGDHIWWISDVRKFQKDYPKWKITYNITDIITEIIEATESRLKKGEL